MIDAVGDVRPGGGLCSGDFAGWVEQLAGLDVGVADVELIDRISELERVKSACAAAQAVLTVAFVASQTVGLSTKRVRDERTRRSVSGQVALARRESPFRGGRHVGLARVLISEMPNVFGALRSGSISEWRATLIVRETACLEVEDRRQVDRELASELGGLSDRRVAQEAARIGQRLDPGVYVARARKAEGDRRVSCRPAPDTMTYVTALVPVAWGVAVYAALVRHAASAKGAGDVRSRGQLMADEFVYRITAPDGMSGVGGGGPSCSGAGRNEAPTGSPAAVVSSAVVSGAVVSGAVVSGAVVSGAVVSGAVVSVGVISSAADSIPVKDLVADIDSEPESGGSAGLGVIPPGVGLDIQLVMSDRTLFDGDNEPAVLTGYGPIPAALARRLVREASPKVKSWVRRLYTDPGSGQLIDADSKRRLFSRAARQFLVARDQTCRGPFCDAPIRHADHVVAHASGGPTRTANGQGLCERCNHTKEQPGWHSRVDREGIIISTPTGHTARSVPPRPPRSTPWAEDRPIEYRPIEHRPLKDRSLEDRPPRHPPTADRHDSKRPGQGEQRSYDGEQLSVRRLHRPAMATVGPSIVERRLLTLLRAA